MKFQSEWEGQRTWRADGVSSSPKASVRLDTQEEPVLQFKSQGQLNQCPSLKAIRQEELPLTPRKVSLSFFFLSSFLPFLAALGPRCCVWAFSSCVKQGLLFVAVCRLLIAVASLLQSTGSRRVGSRAQAQ